MRNVEGRCLVKLVPMRALRPTFVREGGVEDSPFTRMFLLVDGGPGVDGFRVQWPHVVVLALFNIGLRVIDDFLRCR